MPRPVRINQAFVCLKCGHPNPPAEHTCRNHCQQCLHSRHVDLAVPGDRASLCQGLLEPVGLDQNGKKGFIILHKCLKCGHENRNFTAPDDNFDALIQLSRRQNLS
jgi:DNA-directed RNA polymerase subunit RPC12/RpoP